MLGTARERALSYLVMVTVFGATIGTAFGQPTGFMVKRCLPGLSWEDGEYRYSTEPAVPPAPILRGALLLDEQHCGPGLAVARRSRHAREAVAGGFLAVGGGLAAWWSQERADAAYSKYLHSAGIGRRERALRRARRYDRFTGASFLIMQGGIGILTPALLWRNHD